MLRKLFIAITIVLLVSGFLSGTAIGAKTYSADSFDVGLEIQSDGSLLVTETARFRFEGGDFSYVFRELSFRNLDGIDRIQASMDGQAFSEGSGPGQVEIQGTRPIKVTWHFAPTRDIHTFTLSYRVLGVIRQGTDTDMLIWRAIPEDHDYSIQSSTVRIEYPPELSPVTAPTSNRADERMEAGSGMAAFAFGPVDEDEEVDISIQFPAGSLVDAPPAWQTAQERSSQNLTAALPFGLGAAALAGILGIAAAVYAAQGFRRGPASEMPYSQTLTRPPANVAPGLVGRLTGSSTGFLGTLFDLAERGYLRIEEGPKTWFGRSFEVVRLPVSGALVPHEDVFLQTLFKKNSDRVSLNEIGSLASSSEYSRALDIELINSGWRDPQRQSQRRRFLVWTGLGSFLGACIALAGILLYAAGQSSELLRMFAAVLVGAGGAGGTASLIGLLIAASISTLSDEGVRQAAAWNSFTMYLRGITHAREANISPAMFAVYLPYCAAFGLATEWAKYFQKLTGVPAPEWFQGLQSSLDDGSFVAIFAAISAADSSASSASGADGGASGGGSSGAG